MYHNAVELLELRPGAARVLRGSPFKPLVLAAGLVAAVIYTLFRLWQRRTQTVTKVTVQKRK